MVFQDMTDCADYVRMKLKMKFILCFNVLYRKLSGKSISHEKCKQVRYILMSSHSETVIHNVATYLYYHLNYNKSYLKAHDSISLDVMIYYMLDGIP